MLTKLFTYRTGIVIILVTAISSVFVCQVLCDLDIYSVKRNCNTVCDVSDRVKPDNINVHSSSNHHHDSKNSHDHHNQFDIKVSHQSNHPERDEDCCDDMTTQIFESLINQKTNIPSLDSKLFFIYNIDLPNYQLSFKNRFTDFFKFYSDSSPPINGQKIIVIVQSFLL